MSSPEEIQIWHGPPQNWAWMADAMRSLPGGERLTPSQCFRAIERSVVLIAKIDGMEMGFLRLVSDGTSFSSITDLWVEPSARGMGIGTKLVASAMKHPEIAGTVCVLRCEEGLRSWYGRSGFEPRADVMGRVA